MENEMAFLERRITEGSVRAIMADSDGARAAHLGLLKLYRERLGSIRQDAAEAVRPLQVDIAA